MSRKKDNTYLIPDLDELKKEEFLRNVEKTLVLRRQFYRDRFKRLSCRCVRGNCKRKNHLCKVVTFKQPVGNETIQFNYARGALLAGSV